MASRDGWRRYGRAALRANYLGPAEVLPDPAIERVVVRLQKDDVPLIDEPGGMAGRLTVAAGCGRVVGKAHPGTIPLSHSETKDKEKPRPGQNAASGSIWDTQGTV